MPGIVGLITKRPNCYAKAQVAAMLKTIQHEDFYKSGTLSDDALGIYAGWTALRGSFSDNMPLTNEKQDLSLIFSGQDYPDPGIVSRLRARGHCIGSASSEYLIHLYEDKPNFLEFLNGMFHGLIIDRTRDALILFNDRYGMHRLYYYDSGDSFYFATEAKAILAMCPELRTFDPRGLGDFIALSCVLEDRTIFRGIHVLPAASSWTFRGAQLVSKNTYFSPRQWEEQSPLQPDGYQRELQSTLATILPRYFAGQERLGMAMTGGLDTRVILASHASEPGSLPSYTFGSKYRETYDVRVGRQVATICGQSHEVIEVGQEFLTRFPKYAERSVFITEGTVDLSRASDLYLSEKVRQIASAKIVGTYGSEIVRHAVMFKPVKPIPGLFNSDLLPEIDAAGSVYTGFRQEHPVTFAAFRQSPWYHYGILALEQSQLTVRSPFMDNNFVRTVYRAPRNNGPDQDVRLRLIREGEPALARIRSDRGVGGEGSQLSSILVRACREFTFKAEYAYDYGMPQSLSRIDHLFSRLHFERLFFGRHKLLHFRTWYRDELADYVRQMLLDPVALSRPYVDKRIVEKVVKSHLSGTKNYTESIHKLLTLELLERGLLSA